MVGTRHGTFLLTLHSAKQTMITGVVLARNEARHIVACLEALRPHVAELLLIDMQSSDETVALARPLVHKVLAHKRVLHFDSARNLAVPEAAHDWLWYVDADERVPTATGRLVNDLVRNRGDEFEALTIPFKSYFCGQWMQHCGWWPGYTMPRVLKRGHFRFAERVHQCVELNGRSLLLPPDPTLGIDHYSYEDLTQYVEKLNRYTDQEAAYLREEGQAWDWQAAMRAMFRETWDMYERKEGRRDGTRGWLLCWLSGQYRWLSHAKLLSDQTDSAQAPPDLDAVLAVLADELARGRARSPTFPLGIVWRSPIWSYNGYAEEGRTLVKALAGGARPLRLEAVQWNSADCRLPAHEERLLRALTRAERPRDALSIIDCIPSVSEPDPAAAVNVLRTTFETDRIPVDWLPRLARFDEVWVISEHNVEAFRRSGVPPEKLRRVPSCVDTELYRPDGPWLARPEALTGRFLFLSVFDWQLRKGWDVLLSAYCQEFRPDEEAGLLLKISHVHGYRWEDVLAQADRLLQGLGQSLAQRPDVVMSSEPLEVGAMASLYRGADAFVLASRGEGWGRPLMEAMASGLPTIGTRGSGNVDFMNADNSFLVDATPTEVPEAAAREISIYRGHRWCEPDREQLQKALRLVFEDPVERRRIASRGRADIVECFGLEAGAKHIEEAVRALERRHAGPMLPPPRPDQLRVEIEGELFAGHSFANINEQLVRHLGAEPDVALRLVRRTVQPTTPAQFLGDHDAAPFIDRDLGGSPEVTIRHCFPPNWDPPAAGKWVHIQPWEFGHLPTDWIEPLRDSVDEVWAPSEYVKKVYVRSGIPAAKIQVIPWGIDPQAFRADATPLLLPSAKSFRFLFVGGTIVRKGFDRLLEAYLAEFSPDEDVCLVIKDQGSQSWYADNLREQILAARQDPRAPAIVYLEHDLTPGQLASLYTACHCLAAPYRGEGFGLPVLEAMACGLPTIVPRGGATDDFVSEATGYLLGSREIETLHVWPLCGPALELEVSGSELRRALRTVFQNQAEARKKGLAARRHVHASYSWEHAAAKMLRRLEALAGRRVAARKSMETTESSPPPAASPAVAASTQGNSSPRSHSGPPPLGSDDWLPEPWLRPHVPSRGRTFVDIGANYGAWTRWLATRFDQIHAVEPNPAALIQLRHELPAHVTVHEVGAWNKAGQVRFSQFSQSVHLSAYFTAEGINTGPRCGEVELPCKPVDELPIPGPVDFLKCDTEGAECECLEGAAQLIARDRPRLVIEIHSAENFQRVTRQLALWRYLFQVVRDPNYPAFSRLWFDHCWLVAEPLDENVSAGR